MIVIDANIALHAAIPGARQAAAIELFQRWIRDAELLVAPDLWLIECATGIRREVFQRHVSVEDGQRLFAGIEALEVDLRPIDPALCRAALDWAERLGQSRAYDALYLALAERLGVELWTADQRLANGARTLGVDWVRFGEP
jgi:predicted nucleic acid-binding protein